MPRGSLIVQKFGGSSVADAAGICRAARRIAKTREAGYQVVAVVSAMGDTTDQLSDLAAEVSQKPNPGALDALLSMGEAVSSSLLAIALVDCGLAARTFTGSQAGLITDSVHGKARITDVRPGRIRACLDHGTVPIVAGFQGRTQKGRRITTLGRGGSDLTAVALAAALGAGICEIYTDVAGVYTADPRIVPTARKIAALSSEEMLEFAACGSKVMHLRSVEYARRFGLPIHVRSSFTDEMGTLILPGLDRSPFHRPASEQAVITEVFGCEALAEITVAGLHDHPENMSALFRYLSQAGINIQTVVQKRSGPVLRTDIVFSLPAAQAATALSTLSGQQTNLDFDGLHHNDRSGKVMLSGLGMRSAPAVFSTFFTALSEAGVNLDLIEISETGLSALTKADELEKAVGAVRAAFGLATDGVGNASAVVRLAAARGPRSGGTNRLEAFKDGRRPSSPTQASPALHTLQGARRSS
ncbi:aspartate kinase [uncultured Arthrobacter sp.]|uniref:aspartate kinase n=1 Tax=uncultured Arthrobacter sp. TaxID=114050 RepID=UPI0028D51C22|nr:aspartate kinase [uncultured Arthrobacter sp.]